MPVDWTDLSRELACWEAAGRAATLWWRDDDAVSPTPALERLLSLSTESDVPVALAVVPAGAEPGLGPAVVGRPGVYVMQHGWAHRDHSSPGEKSAELGVGRPARRTLAELARGGRRLRSLFGAVALPALVPPWNRIDPALLPELPAVGLTVVSTYAARRCRCPAPGLSQTNCHADLIDWRGTRGFKGEAPVLAELVGHLQGRREGRHDPEEPTGILSHHLQHDPACWTFLQRLFERTRGGARWLDAARACACA